MRCCFHIASDTEPWPHGSDSCHNTGCALYSNKQTHNQTSYHDVSFSSKQTMSTKQLHTILCLYSSEASCTAVSHALEPLAQTLLTSSIQYLQINRQCSNEALIVSVVRSDNPVSIISTNVNFLLCWSSKSHVIFLQNRDNVACCFIYSRNVSVNQTISNILPFLPRLQQIHLFWSLDELHGTVLTPNHPVYQNVINSYM